MSGSAPGAPTPADVVRWRIELVRAWAPDGQFTRIIPTITRASQGSEVYNPEWEHAVARDAALWHVGGEMCDLLAAAAPDLPAAPLRIEQVPDLSGLVVFAKPLGGLDSNGSPYPVIVQAMQWGPAIWNERRCLGVTVYAPFDRAPWLLPIGTLAWPFGEPPDVRLPGTEAPKSNPAIVAALDIADQLAALDVGRHPDQVFESMAEDRRRLTALWLLSSQPGLARSERRPGDRASKRASERAGYDPLVRVVQLRHRPADDADAPAGVGRTYRHRWTVSGHWRNQAVGPRWSEHRPVYVNPHLKGPDDAPLLTAPKVKSWTR